MRQIQVYLGTGGVGKTSVSAAAALHAALQGQRALVLTIDPARRLRTVLHLDSEGWQQKVDIDSFSPEGELWAAMLDVGSTLDRAVEMYAKEGQAEVILNHPIYRILVTSLAGMQELLAIERLAQALKEDFETIVIDTAPSRHAIDFLNKPEFFSQLVSFPLVRLVGRTYKLWERSPFSTISRKSIEIYSRVEGLLGSTLTRQILDFYSVFRSVAEGYAQRATKTTALLRDPERSEFNIVTTPFKAARDAEYFVEELEQRSFPIGRLLVNRVWPELALNLSPDAPALAREGLEWYRNIRAAHCKAYQFVVNEFSGQIPEIVQIPELASDITGLGALYQVSENGFSTK